MKQLALAAVSGARSVIAYISANVYEINKATALQNARINTAGAYGCLNGFYPLAIGIQPHHGHIPIGRLGVQREAHETGWQCAVREVYEETKLQIKPLIPQTTCVCDWDDMDTELQEIQWQHKIEQEPVTLQQDISRGGRAILNAEFDMSLVLGPLAQLR